MPGQYGVYSKQKGGGIVFVRAVWLWKCTCGTEAKSGVQSRVAARQAYALHHVTCTQLVLPLSKEKQHMATAIKQTRTAKKTAVKKKATPKAAATKGPVKKKWYIGVIKRDGGRTIYPNVTMVGKVFPYQQKRLGVKTVPTWWEVEAVTRVQAIAKVVAKDGKKRHAKRAGK